MNERIFDLSLPSLILIIFILLKVFNVVNWSWWIILIPLWVIILMFVAGMIFALILFKGLSKEIYKEIFKK